MGKTGLNHGEAKRFVEVTDRGRAEFVRRVYGADVTDPHLYDLTVNTEQIDEHGVADLVTLAYRRTLGG